SRTRSASCCRVSEAKERIRCELVTGVQTCALPILQSGNHRTATHRMTIKRAEGGIYGNAMNIKLFTVRRCQHALMHFRGVDSGRSEERRVGKERRPLARTHGGGRTRVCGCAAGEPR